MNTPTLLLILDGWGQAPAGPGNAVSLAKTPNIDALLAQPAQTRLACSGREVGLPAGYMGNSEVGHMNIGAGRIVYQDMTRIDITLENGTFASTPAIAATIAATKAAGGTLHLLGLLSDGGVHSHIHHLFALLDAAKAAGLPTVVHTFMDGRDTDPHSGKDFMRALEERGGRVATVVGRYYAMDRDKRWDRTREAWEALVHGAGQTASSGSAAVEAAYATGETDEFIKPRIVVGPDGVSVKRISDNDGVFLFNFRADRVRQITRCLFDDTFAEFDRCARPKLAALASMTAYEADFPLPAAFTRQALDNGLGAVVSGLGMAQLRIAETEKYAHVTYFFNGGVEAPLPLEDRKLVPSPRDVATYDLKPQMSAAEVTDFLVEALRSRRYPFIVCNLANMDMVGHSGIIPAAVAAAEAVDACVGRIWAAVQETNGRLIMTADHGNAEEMLSPEGTPQTAHSKNPVALVVAGAGAPTEPLRPGGKLADIAPTILHLWNIPRPTEMTGQNLLENA